MRSNDPVSLSWAQSVLAAVGIEAVVLDMHTSILEGSIGAIPRRLMVLGDDLSRARHAIETAATAEGLPSPVAPS